MTLYAYRLKRLPLTGWSDFERMFATMLDYDDEHAFAVGWRDRVELRAGAAVRLFVELGWDGDLDATIEVVFAPLPVADPPFADSEFMVALQADDATYIASPIELPWLAGAAIDSRRTDADEPSGVLN